jgi:hypothetical protein
LALYASRLTGSVSGVWGLRSRAKRVEKHHPRFLPVWFASFLASFLVFGVIGWLEIGWHAFWRHLFHPHVDGPAFDLLMSVVAGTYAVGITLYLGAVASFIVTISEVNERRRQVLVRFLGSWWLFCPTLFWYLATNLLVGGAWGFPRFWAGIIALICLGPLALFGFGKLALGAADLLSAEGGIIVDPVAKTAVPR